MFVLLVCRPARQAERSSNWPSRLAVVFQAVGRDKIVERTESRVARQTSIRRAEKNYRRSKVTMQTTVNL